MKRRVFTGNGAVLSRSKHLQSLAYRCFQAIAGKIIWRKYGLFFISKKCYFCLIITIVYEPTFYTYQFPVIGILCGEVHFSAKERDTETGLSYFDARYYSSDLSIWLSVDPMSDKYPSLSPYVYCADNPVRLVDPNGEDYVVVVDEKKQTMTIKAIYYTAKDNKSELQEGLDIWNSQSGRFYHKMNGKNYEVVFDLQVAEGDFSTDSEARSAAFGDGKMSVNNYFEKSSPGVNKRGATTDGNIIQLDPEIGGKRSLAHEIGHTIGIGEWTFGLMSQGTEETQITRRNVLQTMARAGLGRKPTATHFYNNPIDLETRWSHVGKGSFFTVVNGY